jgi:hypothetical protein
MRILFCVTDRGRHATRARPAAAWQTRIDFATFVGRTRWPQRDAVSGIELRNQSRYLCLD